jgi:signal transduction histidine kinase
LRDSLLGRLVLRVLAVTIFFVAITLAGLLLQFLEQTDTLRDRDLSGQAFDIARYVSVDPATGDVAFALPEHLRQAYESSDGMFLYVVLDGDGNRLFGAREAPTAIAREGDGLPPLNVPFRVSRTIAGEAAIFYGVTVPVARGERVLYVQVAQGPGHGDALADEFLSEVWEAAWWYLLVFILLLVGVVYITVRTSLRPVNEVSRQAAAITPSNMGARLGAENLPRELAPLVETMNNALARIEEAYRKQREFTDDAAHELRTPIAILRAHVESKGYGDALLADVTRLERIVEQLLRLARADNFVLAEGARADFVHVARQVVELLGPDAVHRGVALELDAPDAPVAVAGEDGFLVIAVRNVVENALNVTPGGGCVRLSVTADGALIVDDSGQGLAAADRERIFERFWRADKAAKEGAGLGLSIVRRIVDVHGGVCDIADSPLGGLRFAIRLRAAGGPSD